MASAVVVPGRAASIALVSGAVWALLLLVAGFLAPFYDVGTTSSSGETTRSTQTLVGANGLGVVVVLALPLLATLLVAGALALRPRRGAMVVAWTVTGLVAALTVLAIATIGLFVAPVTAALTVACASTSGSKSSAGQGG